MRPPDTHRRPGRLWAPVVRSSAFVRKELAEILRQPRLLALLVLGPFLLLLLFGAGYSQNNFVLRAVFVGPEDSIYEEVIDTYEEDLRQYIDVMDFVSSESEATASLRAGDVDVVVVFPDDPVATVLDGERAVIRVIHDEIDPLQQTAINVATRLAVQEVNATVLTSLAAQVQEGLTPAGDIVREIGSLADELEAAGDDPSVAATVVDELNVQLGELSSVIDGSVVVLSRLESESEAVTALEQVRGELSDLRARSSGDAGGAAEDGDAGLVELPELASDVRTFVDGFEGVVTLDPVVLVKPFDSTTETLLPEPIEPNDYFIPSSLALLLQHLGVTFAALSLVRDRTSGLFELLRVGPLTPPEIIVGKSVAYLLLGGGVAAALLVAATFLLGVPMQGEVWWLAAVVVGVVLASLALGLVMSLASSTESQAVQFAMLSLLAGLFFSGFVLSIDDLVFPVSLVPFLLPVTYGIRSLQDVMFRGVRPDTVDLVGLAALVVVYGSVAVVALQRKLRIR